VLALPLLGLMDASRVTTGGPSKLLLNIFGVMECLRGESKVTLVGVRGARREREGGGGPTGVFRMLDCGLPCSAVGVVDAGVGLAAVKVGVGAVKAGVGVAAVKAGVGEAEAGAVEVVPVVEVGVETKVGMCKVGIGADASSEPSPFVAGGAGRGLIGAGREGPEIESRE